MRRGMLVAGVGGLALAAACASLDGLSGGPTAATDGGAEAAASPFVDAGVDVQPAQDADPDVDSGAEDGDASDGSTIGSAPTPLPIDLAVNDVATCVLVKGNTTFTACFGATSPSTPPYLGVRTSPASGFAQPATMGALGTGTPLLITQLFGGGGSWFLAGAPLAYAWGANDEQQTGTTAATPVLPTALSSGQSPMLEFDHASAGPTHGCGTVGAKLWCWGQNDKCESDPTSPCTTKAPVTEIEGVLGVQPTAWNGVAAGAAHSCAIFTQENTPQIVCWGDNSHAQLGTGNAGGQNTSTLTTARAIAVGDNHSCALDGTLVYCWGDNSDLQSAPQSSATSVPPHGVGSLPASLDQLYAGANQTCVTTTAPATPPGGAYCFGGGVLGGAVNADNIAEIIGIHGITKMAISHIHTCAIAIADGDPTNTPALFCWGKNSQNQIDPLAPANIGYATPHLVTLPFNAPK